ncbi:MAG: FHA domain-containing protein [Verrucomicrobiota bacterium]
MPFKLVIKNNLAESATAAFTRGDIRHFEEEHVTVGTARDCHCQVPEAADELTEHHFEIFRDKTKDAEEYFVRLLEGKSLYVNLEPVSETRKLVSGDELRSGHYSFRFQKEYRRSRPGRRADFFAVTAKVIIVLLLLVEVFFVYWLPQQIQSQEILASGIIKQETVALLDDSRKRAQPSESADDNQRTHYPLQLVRRELDAMTRFVRKYEQSIPDHEWKRLYANIKKLDSLTREINNNNIFQPLPKPKLNKGVEALLERYSKGNNQDGG